MAKKQSDYTRPIEHINKKTTIGHGRISSSAMNKHKKRQFKKYRGQG